MPKLMTVSAVVVNGANYVEIIIKDRRQNALK